MAHRGQEAALRLVRLLGGLARVLGVGEQPSVFDRDDGLLGKGDQEAQVCGRVRTLVHRPPDSHEPGDLTAHDQRSCDQAIRLEPRAGNVDRPSVLPGVVDELGLGAEEDAAEDALTPFDGRCPHL